MVQQDPHEVSQLVRTLKAAQGGKSAGKKFSCKKSTFPVAGTQGITVDSWKFQDWDYKRDDLPTYARGLFTTQTRNGTPEIAIRGYDKFFNVDEVNLTKWENIQKNTIGPYELSVKENGCIIFMSGLEDGTLLVCSKHSTGARQDADVSHAIAGEKWVRRHVESVGKTERDLAMELRRMNATAVGELCDDNFEEHVLAYDENAAGIYLHGINYNVPFFATLPGAEIHSFADKWGFKKAQFVMKNDISEVRTFLERCAETGSWNGRDTEGFVVRCKMREARSGPYVDWFFKYKFEEPYLMYRQWRECTKAVISGRAPRYKKHAKITEEYLLYARRQLQRDPKLGKLYNQNHGIIAMREGFLKERGLKGSEIIAMEAAEGDATPPIADDIVLVPVASIGCGKTTVALGLVKLFGWGHIQNDNIQGKKDRPKRFAQEICRSLTDHKAVIADRNNHQKRERKQIIEDIRPIVPNARFVALQYVHEPKGQMLDDIRTVTRQRVLERGDNHQTIRAGSKSQAEIIGIMEGFLHRFEAVKADREPDINFDEVIDLDVMASSRENLETVVSALYSAYPRLFDRPKPSTVELDQAIDAAMKDYAVDLKHDLNFGSSKTPARNPTTPIPQPNTIGGKTIEQLLKKVEYFKISLSQSEINRLVSSLFPPGTPPDESKLYNNLKRSRRIQSSFHVTLIHKASTKDHPDIWEQYTNLYKNSLNQQLQAPDGSTRNQTPSLGAARVRLERLLWNDKIMAFVARILPIDHDDRLNRNVPQTMALWTCANETPHVTVGTAAPNVKPKESNDLLKVWLEHGANAQTGIMEREIRAVKVLEGIVGVVLSYH
ncbi:tRNA ligase [Emydomyces testavorans]|uniref:tRNA ligase n=1 Tax=Emydomyces testavorans TaxID=2070801 RepID=A0AAF0ILC0_9EURO|nr:tRNA ligase [Emydomyces testavorans]